VKQVNQATWRFINAAGNTIPSAVVFPHVHFKQFMIRVVSPGTLGVAAHSGWKRSDHTDFSKENISHVLLDKHERHLSIATIDLAKEHSVRYSLYIVCINFNH
jgi:hypothetical protein